MQYFEEMREKYGFSDGEAVPAEAWHARKVYVEAINRLAEKEGSEFRVASFNRAGIHNPFFIVILKKSDAGKLTLKEITEADDKVDDLPFHEVADDALASAIEKAYEFGLDDYVETKVTVDREGLEKALTQG